MAGSKSNGFEGEILRHIFNNTSIVNIGDLTGLPGSTTEGNLYVALYETVISDDSTIDSLVEANYPNYARVGVARNSDEWLISGDNPTQVTNNNLIQFPISAGGALTVNSVGICKGNQTGDNDVLYWANLDNPLLIQINIAPFVTQNGIVIKEY